MLEWKPEYETGVPTVDAQHGMLFNNLNLLETLLAQEAFNPTEANYLLNFLERYATQHFHDEESCMARFRCPAYAKNRAEHANFMEIVRVARAQFDESDRQKEILKRLHESMVWWIHHHILRVDIQLRNYARAEQRVAYPGPTRPAAQSHDLGEVR